VDNGQLQKKPPVLLLTVEEAAESLRLSRTAIFALIKSGELDSVQIGHRRRISLSALTAYVAALSTSPAA